MEEKVLYVRNEYLLEVNRYLENGWAVKSITAASGGESVYAYVVIQRPIQTTRGLGHMGDEEVFTKVCQ